MNVLPRAAELISNGRPFAIATVTWRRGPSSGREGAKALIHPDGTVEGWLGGACAGPSVVEAALLALSTGRPQLLVLGEPDDRPGVAQVAMACASEGAMEVYVEPVLPPPELWVVGNSPMVETLQQQAVALGWRVQVIDHLQPAAIGRRAMVVVATQGHYDEEALQAALATEAAYVGVVASAKRAAALVEYLRSRGVPDEQLARLRAPAGLDLGPIAHEEIAVAILAELVALRSAGAAEPGVEVAQPATVVDPVCGMTVDPANSHHSYEYLGRTYWFCAAGCRSAFEKDPARFLTSS